MKLHFNIEPLKFKTLEVLPGAWSDDDYKKLLEIMDYGDTSSLSSKELEEMCMLSIADNDPDEAARLVLNYVFDERLNTGQTENISHEMTTEKIWEEYAELDMHEGFFNVTQLLYKSFNGKFPHPEAVQLEVKITAKDKQGITFLETDTEAGLLRLLAQGMPDNTLINRLFDDQLKGDEFKDAKDIIWQYKEMEKSEKSITFNIVSSTYWLQDLKFIDAFDAEFIDED